MAYFSASKKARANASKQDAQSRDTSYLIPTVRSRAGAVYVSSRNESQTNIKPISRFKKS